MKQLLTTVLILLGFLLPCKALYAQIAPACNPFFTMGCNGYRIHNFTYAGINNSPVAASCGISNYLSQVASVTAGTPTAYSIRLGAWVNYAIYADFDNNGNFNGANEMIHASGAAMPWGADGMATVNGTLTVPSNVPSGSYRLRVLCVWTGPLLDATSACSSFNLAGGGNFHDYTLTVANSPSCLPPAAPVVTPTSGTASLSWTASLTSAPEYRWKVVLNGANPATDPGVATGVVSGTTATATGLAGSTSYQAYVKSLCSASDSSLWSPAASFNTACSGVPVAGAASASAASVCPGTSFNLVLTGAGTGNGISYQWQSSAAGANSFMNIAGGTATTYATTQSSAKDYRCIVKCVSTGDSGITNVVAVPLSPFLNCYCTPSYSSGSCSSDHMTSVTLGPLNETNLVCVSAPGYVNRTGAQTGSSPALPVPDLTAGQNSTLTLRFGSDGYQYNGVWIDFDQNGVFNTSEFFTTGTNAGANGTANITLSIPAGVLAGITRMRIRGGDDNQPGNGQACGASSSNWGTARDYLVNIVQVTAPPLCVTAPTAPANGSSSCASTTNSTFTWPAAPTASNYDVYLDNGAATTLAGTVTTNSYTTAVPLAAGAYTWKVVPKNFLGAATGCSTFTFTVNPLPSVSVTPVSGIICSSSTLSASGAATYTWSPAAGLSAASGGSVTATPSGTTTYTVTGTDNNGCRNTASTTITPMSSITLNVPAQTLCSGPATINVAPVAAASGAIEYQLTDTLGNVVAGWQSGVSFTITPGYAGLNKYFIFARNTDCPSALSDTGLATVFSGFSATVTSIAAGCANGNGSLVITNAQGTSAPLPGTWYSNDFSTTALDPNRATLYGVAAVTGNALQLTPNSSSQRGALLVKNPQAISDNIDSVTFTTTIPQNGADGFSWSFGDNVAYSTTSELESGTGNKLILAFDAFTNSNSTSPGAAGIYLTYGRTGGGAIPTTVSANMLAYSNNTSWRAASNTRIAIYITPAGLLTLKVGATTVFNQVQLPAAYVNANRSSWQHLFAARTGGSFEQHVIDNLNIYSKVPSFVYGASPAHSGTLPAAWQNGNTFGGLSGGDSLDLWIANPANAATCNQKLGTFGVSATVMASLLESQPPTCSGQGDGYIALGVNTPGTYSASYSKDGGSPVTLTGIVSQNNGSTDIVALPDLAPGSYTNLKVVSAANCSSNVIAGPVVLTDPGATAIAPASHTATGTQTNPGSQHYTDGACGAIATINSGNDLGTVNASVAVGAVPVSTPAGEPLLGRYHEITPGANATLPVRLTLYYSQDDFDSYNSSSLVGGATYPAIAADGSNLRIKVYHGSASSGTTGPNGSYDATNADLIMPSGVVLNSNGFWEVTFHSPNGFSGFFANTNTSTPLYLELGELKAVNAGTVNRLLWNTLKEKAGDRFEIERSKDGRQFTKVGDLKAKGQAPSDYAFTDDKPLSGINYYRLRLVHIDGNATYSKTVRAAVTGQGFLFDVFPNPVTGILNVRLGAVSGKGKLTLRDLSGRLVAEQSAGTTQSVVFDMTQLAAGTYLLQYQDEAHTLATKITKH